MNSLDYSMLKVQYELLNKVYRNCQKDLDREISILNNIFIKFFLINNPQECENQNILVTLREITSQLTNFINLLRDCIDTQENDLSICIDRVIHLKQFFQAETDNPREKFIMENVRDVTLFIERPTLLKFQRIRVLRLLVDHLLRSSFINTAVCLSEENNLIKLVDVDVFVSIRNVEQELYAHNPNPCLAWCNTNKSKLKRLHSTLENNLRIQQFVELIKLRSYSEAILHAEKYLTQIEESFLPYVQCALGLLCFPSDTHLSRYHQLFSHYRWKELIVQFRRDSYSLLQMSSQSHLATTLQAGLSALKTHLCCSSVHVNKQCPLCISPFNQLADILPYAKITRSRLICPITTTLMNEDNIPMALPNCRLYGEQGLLKLLNKDGTFTCPITNEHFHLNECKKVYIL